MGSMTFELIVLLLLCCVYYVRTFTCQGATYQEALTNCPDQGYQKMSSGGNVSFLVKSAFNLPKKALISNPYVKFTAGSVSAKSSYAHNTLNPVWNDHVSLGVLGSGTLVNVEVWDYNIGLNFGDLLLASSSMRVPFCSTFTANDSTIECGEAFGCRSDDSSWAMPTRQVCNETGYISFSGDNCLLVHGVCLYIDVLIVPFTMEIEYENKVNIKKTPQLSAAGKEYSAAPWTSTFGKPFLGDSTTLLDLKIEDSTYLIGALMFRMLSTDKARGAAESVSYYLSVNFPANVYVCRSEADKTNGVPGWLNTEFNSANATVYRLKLSGANVYFDCYFYTSSGTVKNRYGGVKSGAIAIRSNTVSGHDGDYAQDLAFFHYPYIVLAIPRVIAQREDTVIIRYDMSIFVNLCFSYGLIWAWFMFIVARFLAGIKYRIDRIPSFLVSRVMHGENKTVLALLFTSYLQTPCNVEFRSRLYHTKNAIYLVLALPQLLLAAWGFSIAGAAQPTALGIAVGFIGTAAVSFWFGFSLWKASNWRMSPIALVALSSAVVLFLCFIVSVIFVDPAVEQFGYDLNLTALSLFFGTMNVIPLLLLVFRQDKNYKVNMKIVANKMKDAIFRFREATEGKEKIKQKGFVSANKLLHALLGPCYTVNPAVPEFKYATVLLDQDDDDEEEDEDVTENNKNVTPATEIEPPLWDGGNDLYHISLAILLIYIFIAVARTRFPSLAFLNCLALILFDGIHTSLGRGDNRWSPGFKIALLVLGRMLIMGSSGTYWVIMYSLAYKVYGAALTQEIINQYLPMLSKRRAGEIVFAGKDDEFQTGSGDIAGSEAFNFVVLTFAFICVLLVSCLGKNTHDLPTPYVLVWLYPWPSLVFGVIAILAIITTALMSATIRAFYLKRHGLLRGWARESYLLKRIVNVPMILAGCTEVAVLFSGLLVYGITGTSLVLTLCVFLPILVGCFGYAYHTWVKNDYELVVWPPRDDDQTKMNDAPSDLETAFHMIENVFGEEVDAEQQKNDMFLEDIGEANVLTEKRALKGFKLPKMEPTGNKVEGIVKMPPLPLKSVLRRKRQNLNIPVKKEPVLMDLKAREGADVEAFGSAEDVIDLNDPWKRFELEEEEERRNRRKKKAVKPISTKRTGFMKHPHIVWIRDSIDKSPACQYIIKYLSLCMSACRVGASKYAKVGIASLKYAKKENDSDSDNEEEDPNKPKEGEEQHQPADNDNKSDAPVKTTISIVPEADDFSKMPFWSAAIGGFLTPKEYGVLAAWFGGLLMVMFFGITLGKTCAPEWIGYVVWIALWTVICTAWPVIKYFNTYAIDEHMRYSIYFVGFLHFMFCVCFFAAKLDGDAGVVASLWIFDYFIYFPIFLYAAVEAYRWADNGFKMTVLEPKTIDAEITVKEYLYFFKDYPIMIVLLVLLLWQFFIWVSAVVGQVAVIALMAFIVGYWYVRDWALNDFFLSPELRWLGKMTIYFSAFISFCVALFSTTNPIFPLSVFFFCILFTQACVIANHIVFTDPDTVFFFSPVLMPIYSYDPRTSDIKDESEIAKLVLYFLLTFMLWGSFMAVFEYPVSIGIAIACVCLLTIVGIVTAAVSFIPLRLGKVATMIHPESIIEAAGAARSRFIDRRSPLSLEVASWNDGAGKSSNNNDENEFKKLAEKTKSSVDRRKEMMSIELASEIMEDTRSLTHMHDDAVYTDKDKNRLDDIIAGNKEVEWYVKYWQIFKAEVKRLFEKIPTGRLQGWKKHSEALFTFTDAMAEMLITGRGPLGWLGVEGGWFMLSQYAEKQPRLKFLYQPWLKEFDELGNRKNRLQLLDHFDSIPIFNQFLEMDTALDHAYKEETRAAVHFLMMNIVYADAKMQREQVLVQKFFRENRFKLASNGITPPPEIFSSASFASIDIPLVAVWLSTLTEDERERFHHLKATFSEEQKDRDEAIDNADYQFAFEAQMLLDERKNREQMFAEQIARDMDARRQQRIDAIADSLHPVERSKFLLRKDDWLKNPASVVDPKEAHLYARFYTAMFEEKDETIIYARQVLAEIEAVQKDCRFGEYGRAYQFVDSTFFPGDQSIGTGHSSSYILGWRCAPGINDMHQLIAGHPTADEVEEGIFKNPWLVSAITMLAAVSTQNAVRAGDGDASLALLDQIMSIFVGRYTDEGDYTYRTEVGAYCARLYRRGIWFPIILDDLFPMIRKENWTSENRGMACAHAKECTGLWVSLIEKAFAKFYGNYTELEKGFIHHALQAMTGAESECITLSAASRGVGKRSLWESLCRYKKNGYILGAGTGESTLVDKEIQDMGIIFNAAYVIYDVFNIDGYKLIKLRNPPGDHSEWRGDWGDKSKLWTRRLQKKLGHIDADDNIFFMAFDDFCNVFRYLYVCKWHDPHKWYSKKFNGLWQKGVVTEFDMSISLSNEMIKEAGFAVEKTDKEKEEDGMDSYELRRKRAREAIDTAGGLPTKHNPGCILENNPHYTLRISRPTDMCISVSQVDTRGAPARQLHPFSILVVTSKHPREPMRIGELTKENIVCSSGEAKEERVQLLHTSLKPGLYIILVPTYVAGLTGNFTIEVTSSYKTELHPLWPPNWVLKPAKTKKAKDPTAADGDGSPEAAAAAAGASEEGGGGGVAEEGAEGGDKTDKKEGEEDKQNKLTAVTKGMKVVRQKLRKDMRQALQLLLGAGNHKDHFSDSDEEEDEDEDRPIAARRRLKPVAKAELAPKATDPVQKIDQDVEAVASKV